MSLNFTGFGGTSQSNFETYETIFLIFYEIQRSDSWSCRFIQIWVRKCEISCKMSQFWSPNMFPTLIHSETTSERRNTSTRPNFICLTSSVRWQPKIGKSERCNLLLTYVMKIWATKYPTEKSLTSKDITCLFCLKLCLFQQVTRNCAKNSHSWS